MSMGRFLNADFARTMLRSGALTIAVAASAAGAVLAGASPAAASDKDDRSMAKAADDLIQLFIGPPASLATPPQASRPKPVSAAHTVHTAVVHHAASAAVAAAPGSVAAPAATAVVAPVVVPVVRHDYHPVPVIAHAPAGHVVASEGTVKHGATDAKPAVQKSKPADVDDWLKESGPQGADSSH